MEEILQTSAQIGGSIHGEAGLLHRDVMQYLRNPKDKQEIFQSKRTQGCLYNMLDDKIFVPAKTDFKHLEGYYYGLFHEIGHSTCYMNRMDRDALNPFMADKEARAEEEVLADMFACFILQCAGLLDENMRRNSEVYFKGYLLDLTMEFDGEERDEKMGDILIRVTMNVMKIVEYVCEQMGFVREEKKLLEVSL